ncbi:MAG: glycosyltransferase [Acidimicrobiales bacterium]
MAGRLPVSIVILAWNAWEETQACLESLRPTLGLHDQVIVVDNGSRDATPARLRLFPWVEIVTNEENRGFAAGCNQGAALARHDVVVFLNNDTVLTGRWIEPLVAPFDDPVVGATGPRSNFVSGPQVAEGVTYGPGDRAGLRAFARAWASEHRGQVTRTDRLVGFCLAVRTEAFRTVGGFDEGYEVGGFEDDDLCRRLTDAGWELVVAHECFVHHAGHRTFDVNDVDWFAQQELNRGRFEEKFGGTAARDFPLVSACLIVKDEEENLPSCLASLAGVADEVVVYDTGSSDRTVELARQAGAIVLEGYWDDDFSRARNAALEHCHGEWIAWLDADETLRCDDPTGLRELLARTAPDVDGFSVTIDNATGAGVGAMFVHSACRFFRRARCEWSGRLHEQVAGRKDHRPVTTVGLDLARIHHTGYTNQAMAQREKAARNLRVAEAEVERSDGWERGFSLTSLGRSYMTAGRAEEALEYCRRGAAETANPITRRLALRTVVDALAALGRTDEALEAIGDLRAASERQVLADLLEANVRRQLGEHERALELLAALSGPMVDDDGFEYDPSMFAQKRADSLVALGRFSEAADALLAGLSDRGVLDDHLGTLVEYLERAGRPLTDLTRAIPADNLPLFLAQVLQLVPTVADQVLEAAATDAGDGADVPLEVLATAANLAPHLAVDRALVWSSRLRARGLGQACPLVALASDPGRTPVDRCRAAAVAVHLFGDEGLGDTFGNALAAATPADRAVIATEVAALCPPLAERFATQLTGTRQPDGVNRPPAGRAANDDPRSPSTAVHDGASLPGGRQPVTIVIPCWNRAEQTVRCLQAIQATTAPGTYEVVLVDNGSTDATATLSGDPSNPVLTVLRNDTNRGYAVACNQGARISTRDVVVFLDNDAEVQPGWLDPLLDELDRHLEVGAVGARLLCPDGTVEHAGADLVLGGDGTLTAVRRGVRSAGDDPAVLVREEVPAVSSTLLAVRRDAFWAVGGFDETSPTGDEDVDVCLSLRAAGWRVVYRPDACAVHHRSAPEPGGLTAAAGGRRWLHGRWADRVVVDGGPRSDEFRSGCRCGEGTAERVTVLGSFTGDGVEGRLTSALLEAGTSVVTTSLEPGAWGTALARLGRPGATLVAVLPRTIPLIDVTELPEWETAEHRLVVCTTGHGELAPWQRRLADAADGWVEVGPSDGPAAVDTILEALGSVLDRHLPRAAVAGHPTASPR